jgi:sulfite reductase (NADPH) hemoprotein beta-component
VYQYDQYDQAIVDDRASQFGGQVSRRLDGEVTELEFKPLRLQNGVYMQLHAYMLRIAIPYGLLSSTQMRKLAHIARTYDKGYGHFTTRQNVQFNWPTLQDVPTILEELASVQMHAIQTSGNCIRNTTSDPFAGVSPDELEDPRPYCELIRQWSTFHPEFAALPRKFKIAVTGTPDHDRAAIRYHDIGIRIVEKNEQRGFEIWVGGGMGRTPFIGQVVRSFLPYEDLLTYLESIMRVYNLHGRRDNKYKARIKVLLSEMGLERFRSAVEAEWEVTRNSAMKLTRSEIDRIAAHFAPPEYESLRPHDQELQRAELGSDRAFAQWLKTNVRPHKVTGYKIAVISLKAKGLPPGDASDTQMDALANLADKYTFGRMVVTHTQNIVFPDVPAKNLRELHAALLKLDLATANFELVTDSICCPGLDFCALANARSIPLALELRERFDAFDYAQDIGPCSVKISGCINACGHHHVGNIGLLGIDKHGHEAYQIMLGGCESDQASLGKIIGPALPPEQVVDAVEAILQRYVQTRNGADETFLQCFRRVGMEPFKEAAYARN